LTIFPIQNQRNLLKQFNFETLPPALDGEINFAYACGAGGGARRQSVSTFSMLKRSKQCLLMNHVRYSSVQKQSAAQTAVADAAPRKKAGGCYVFAGL
jgi:hypothetical protein